MREEFSYGTVVYSKFNNECKYLLLKREEGWLDFPKGHIEKGEDGVKAALRETCEESGVCLQPGNLVHGFYYNIDYFFTYKGTKILKHVGMYLSEVLPETTVKVSYEHRGYVWLNYQEAMEELRFGNQKGLLEYTNTYIEKLDRMRALNKEYSEIYRGRKWDLSTSFVPGEGNLNAAIFIVGQAPGRNEDIMKKPFVGRSGKLLESLITDELHMDRESLYITSVVQFFPPENRAPSDDEIALCLPYLMKQIEIVNPAIIVLLGAVAARTLVQVKSIMKEHGKLFMDKYFVTLHPAAALRNPANVEIMRSDFRALEKIVNGRQ
ncbi:uracil-DNA glycosylase family protein [Ferroplasma acidarmanus]|uniref:Bis(5'-nucleosyl)-tetraphosphatase [asymmetrical] n=1 Tax=Ferroplasma acidarmanus Fer1 TaxID=333146 RepID=S0AQL4_FERAC|nr:uracil-DNA glycosylase family protein [Ferroplasma acidarmanus]AGO60320.1 DNA polymerase [Ferroplasma acidarmanus Fer1]